MKTDLQELIDTANKLCRTCDEILKNDRMEVEIAVMLENLNWEVVKIKNNFVTIKEFYGV